MSDHTEIIERFLRGEMTPDERIAFERRLGTDEALFRELALQRRIQTDLGDARTLEFFQKIQQIDWENESARRRQKRYRAAAFFFIAVLAATLLFILLQPETVEPEDKQLVPTSRDSIANDLEFKYDSFEKEQPSAGIPPKKQTLTSIRWAAGAAAAYQKDFTSTAGSGIYLSPGGNEAPPDSISAAFDQKNYPLVLALAEMYPESGEKFPVVAWTAANAAFLLNDCKSAIFYTTKVGAMKKLEYLSLQAEYLLLLTYVKCGETDRPAFKVLLAKVQGDRSHPGWEFASER